MHRMEHTLYRARAAWWEDGIPETLSGLGLVILGLVGWATWSQPSPSPGWTLLWFGLLIGLSVGMKPLMLRAKSRWSWNRTGYSRPRRELDLTAVFLLLAAMAGVVLAVQASSPLVQGTGLAVFVGCLMGSLYRYARVPRFLVYGLVGGVLALGLGMRGYPGAVSVHLTLMVLGGLFLLSGLPRWWRLRHLPETPHDG